MSTTQVDSSSMAPSQPSVDVTDTIRILEEPVHEEQKHTNTADENLVYDDDEHEPDLHARTWIALAGFCLYSFTQLFALLGPPTVLGLIAVDLDGFNEIAWVPNAMVLVQAALVNLLATASDLFQARKRLLIFCLTLAFIGAAIAPGSKSVGRLIAAQTLIGFGNAIQVLAFTVPSEILPKRWRPMAQALILCAGAFAMVASPVIISAFVKRNVPDWRNFYWIETGLWGSTVLFILIGYRPPKRHTRLDHLSFWQKLFKLDLIGSFILAAGLVLLLTGLSMGGPAHPWRSAETLSTLLIGSVALIVFFIYEWKGTKTGILHHELFNHSKANVRTFVICLMLVFVESPMLYTMILEYPLLTQAVFEPDLVLASARVVIYYAFIGVGNVFWGALVVKLKSIREALMSGFVIHLIGTIGFCFIQPNQNANAIAFSAVMGFGMGAILGQVTAGVQLVSPHAHLAKATALALSVRAAMTTACVPIYTSVVNSGLSSRLPEYVARAATSAGLPEGSLSEFVDAISTGQVALLPDIPGVTENIISAGTHAVKQANVDSIRYTYIISVPFCVIGGVLAWWIGDLKKVMTWHVDAPVEKLAAKVHCEKQESYSV
ncbi:uncharacterized protein A1O9_09171 [Exophiala aquamarina CBS 119918]|uniref:Major facilitator superfamily (MFS) profile domain-containing protein n=1 Tax=Exophiala aquamarina CBS 119918 TaxID=1182545 RepID=A0A072P3N4_9EURO|nr:uncharacterized protein A1O9_09171 [Exophiala aquamarina CBS 119918]KEF54729.1 hypothetical protein A1O9_09171 [Exophiala aquamarina CBS 119918]